MANGIWPYGIWPIVYFIWTPLQNKYVISWLRCENKLIIQTCIYCILYSLYSTKLSNERCSPPRSGSNEVEEGGDAPGRVHSKFDRGYKISEVLSAAIFLTELAGTRVREIRESGGYMTCSRQIKLYYLLLKDELKPVPYFSKRLPRIRH